MIAIQNSDGSFSASGDGVFMPIVVEGETRREAIENFISAFAAQYRRKKAHVEKNTHDYEIMAREARSYKGDF